MSTIQLARRLVREHGIAGAAGMLVRKWIRKLRRKPLPNTAEANRERWTVYDWSRLGEE